MSNDRLWPPRLEAPDGLSGRLQRGLGSAARELLKGRVGDACEPILACVQMDPRWDRQIDDRADYYAVLAIAAGVDAAEVELLAQDKPTGDGLDPGSGLALDVIVRMAVRGDAAATSAVQRYCRTGRYWLSVIDQLLAGGHASGDSGAWPGWVDELAPMFCERFSTVESMREELQSVWYFDSPPWPKWRAACPMIDRALTAISVERSHIAPRDGQHADKPTAELLALREPRLARRVAGWLAGREDAADLELMRVAALDSSLPMHAAAVSALAARHDRAALPAVLQLSDHSGPGVRRALLFDAFAKLPYKETRATAAEWLTGGDETRRSAAAAALAAHAVEDDLELVTGELSRELDKDLDGDQYVVCSLAEALGRHPARGPYPVLDRAFGEMPYSFGRGYVAAAIAATDARFPNGLAVEALWDCEPTVRAIAAEHVLRESPCVSSRLREMCSDPLEDQAARDAAA